MNSPLLVHFRADFASGGGYRDGSAGCSAHPGDPLFSAVKAGVQRIRLADYNVRLSPGEAYRWFVAVVPDADRRSKDILAGGAIERVETPEELKAKLTQTAKKEAPFVYAEAGIWYDALGAISDLIEAAPQDQELQKQRAAMLAQVGLPSITE